MIAAVVPAAGLSQRMGQPKLLLPLDGQSLIGHVVTALREGGADRIVVVAPPSDSAEGPAVAAAASSAGAVVIAPRIRPAEMRYSVEIGIATLAGLTHPRHVMLAPGDAAGITSSVVIRLLEESERHPKSIVVPRHGPRRGHPLVLPWEVAASVSILPAGQGVSALMAGGTAQVIEVQLTDAMITEDIDTPDDYRHWQEQQSKNLAHAKGDALDRRASDKPENRLQLRVMFFAVAKDKAGCSSVDLELPRGSRVGNLRAELARRLPALAPLLKNVMIAVNEEYAGDEAYLTAGARVAVIPPVSGGAGDRRSARASDGESRGSYSP
jgi:molybdenum cofactor cytidylyltransferase